VLLHKAGADSICQQNAVVPIRLQTVIRTTESVPDMTDFCQKTRIYRKDLIFPYKGVIIMNISNERNDQYNG
jgi:hypothetical protein